MSLNPSKQVLRKKGSRKEEPGTFKEKAATPASVIPARRRLVKTMVAVLVVQKICSASSDSSTLSRNM
ncbi:hypothetical protein M0R45_008090 [Rubus argutus]|uniref:Uncharacterized protein n=1 Tax=Rubus argutus TaxID=59490 RepID=A0AAW1Y114_RUBAR